MFFDMWVISFFFTSRLEIKIDDTQAPLKDNQSILIATWWLAAVVVVTQVLCCVVRCSLNASPQAVGSLCSLAKFLKCITCKPTAGAAKRLHTGSTQLQKDAWFKHTRKVRFGQEKSKVTNNLHRI